MNKRTLSHYFPNNNFYSPMPLSILIAIVLNPNYKSDIYTAKVKLLQYLHLIITLCFIKIVTEQALKHAWMFCISTPLSTKFLSTCVCIFISGFCFFHTSYLSYVYNIIIFTILLTIGLL